jgi:hypothetical protein
MHPRGKNWIRLHLLQIENPFLSRSLSTSPLYPTQRLQEIRWGAVCLPHQFSLTSCAFSRTVLYDPLLLLVNLLESLIPSLEPFLNERSESNINPS